MKLTLLSNVVIHGETHQAGTEIDAVEKGVSADSLIAYGWAKKAEAKAAKKAAASEDEPPAGDSTEGEPATGETTTPPKSTRKKS